MDLTGKDEFTNEEAAYYLGITLGTLNVWRCTKRYGVIPYIKVGRKIRYKKSALDKFKEDNTVYK